MLTKKQAFRKIAEKLSDPNYDFRAGICYEGYLLAKEGHITYAQFINLQNHCASYIVPEEAYARDWAYPFGQEREARILAALFFAEGA